MVSVSPKITESSDVAREKKSRKTKNEYQQQGYHFSRIVTGYRNPCHVQVLGA
jgi:hypothetical protein